MTLDLFEFNNKNRYNFKNIRIIYIIYYILGL